MTDPFAPRDTIPIIQLDDLLLTDEDNTQPYGEPVGNDASAVRSSS